MVSKMHFLILCLKCKSNGVTISVVWCYQSVDILKLSCQILTRFRLCCQIFTRYRLCCQLLTAFIIVICRFSLDFYFLTIYRLDIHFWHIMQTVQSQFRCRNMQHLIRFNTVCSQDFL